MEQAQFDKIASEAFDDEMNKIAKKGLPPALQAYLDKKNGKKAVPMAEGNNMDKEIFNKIAVKAFNEEMGKIAELDKEAISIGKLSRARLARVTRNIRIDTPVSGKKDIKYLISEHKKNVEKYPEIDKMRATAEDLKLAKMQISNFMRPTRRS